MSILSHCGRAAKHNTTFRQVKRRHLHSHWISFHDLITEETCMISLRTTWHCKSWHLDIIHPQLASKSTLHLTLQLANSWFGLAWRASLGTVAQQHLGEGEAKNKCTCQNEGFPCALKMLRECTTTVPSSSITSSCGTKAKISPSDPKCFSTAQLEQSNSEQTRSLFLRSLAALVHWAGHEPSFCVTISNKSNQKQALHCLIVSRAAFWTATCFFVSFLFGPFENSGLDKKSNHKAGGPLTIYILILTTSTTTPPTAFALIVSFELSEYSCADLPNSWNLATTYQNKSWTHLQSNKETETLARKGAKA